VVKREGGTGHRTPSGKRGLGKRFVKDGKPPLRGKTPNATRDWKAGVTLETGK